MQIYIYQYVYIYICIYHFFVYLWVNPPLYVIWVYWVFHEHPTDTPPFQVRGSSTKARHRYQRVAKVFFQVDRSLFKHIYMGYVYVQIKFYMYIYMVHIIYIYICIFFHHKYILFWPVHSPVIDKCLGVVFNKPFRCFFFYVFASRIVHVSERKVFNLLQGLPTWSLIYNIAPEKWWLEDQFPFGMETGLPTIIFQGLC